MAVNIDLETTDQVMDLTEYMSEQWGGSHYDLLPRIFRYFDKHLQIEVLEKMIREYDNVSFNPYTKQSLLVKITSLLKQTARHHDYLNYLEKLSELSDYYADNFERLQEESAENFQRANDSFQNSRDTVIDLYFQDETKVFNNRTSIKQIVDEWEENGVEYVSIIHNNNPEQPVVHEKNSIYDEYRDFMQREEMIRCLPQLYESSRTLFELGSYEGALVCLQKYKELVPDFINELDRDKEPTPEAVEKLEAFLKTNKRNLDQSYWGIWVCKLLEEKYSQDCVDQIVNELKNTNNRSLATQTQMAIWVVHWVLYQNFLNDRAEGQGIGDLLDIYMQDIFKKAIVNICPWLLRYYALAAICSNKNLIDKMNECAEIAQVLIQAVVRTYKDPITEFLRSLFVDSDFKGASHHLNECRKVFAADAFVSSYCQVFFVYARLLFFRRYSSVNMKMRISDIGELLLLGDAGNLADNEIYSVGGQPCHYEERNLQQWITETVRMLEQENLRHSAEEEDTGPKYRIRIDLCNGMLLAKPTYEDQCKVLLQNTKDLFIQAKKFAEDRLK